MSRAITWAVDFGQEWVTVLAAESRSGAVLSLVGSAQVPTQGLDHGEFSHAGDVTECLVAALRAAEKSCGLRCESVFYNFDDAQMESHFPVGSKTLAGEGQIRPSDVDQAVASAGRFVGHFEKSVVYSARTSFVIDAKDMVVNPIGVFGRQLDVGLHVLLARAQRLENWQRVMERARLRKGTPVLSALSSVYGVLDTPGRAQKRLVCDLGSDILTAVAVERGILQKYEGRAPRAMSAPDMAQWVLSAREKFFAGPTDAGEILLTGDLASKETLLKRLRETFPAGVRVEAPSGFAPFDRPEHAAATGLLRVGAELRAMGPLARVQKNPMDGLRQKAVSLINEYF